MKKSKNEKQIDCFFFFDKMMGGVLRFLIRPLLGHAIFHFFSPPPGWALHLCPFLNHRMINHMGGINRIRSMPQRPGVVAAWADSGAVRLYDGTPLVEELLAESESSSSTTTKAKAKSDMKPMHSHAHSDEGYALDWSSLKAGRLVSGDCKGKVHVWEPEVRRGERLQNLLLEIIGCLPVTQEHAKMSSQSVAYTVDYSTGAEMKQNRQAETSHKSMQILSASP